MENTTNDLLALKRVRALTASGEALSIRENATLTIPEIARAAEVSPQSVTRWETRERRPHGDGAIRYGAVLEALQADEQQ